MTDADALSRSYAEGARAGRQELLRDLEALRDEWFRLGITVPTIAPLTAADRLTALLDAHAKDAEYDAVVAHEAAVGDFMVECAEHPAGPDLRERVLANYVVVSAEVALSSRPDGAQMLDGQWYVPKWGCDTLEHVLDALAGHTEAGEWRGLWRCEKCNRKFLNASDGEHHYPWDTGNRDAFCEGAVRPYERRKGG